jgi:hypothetical protein
MPNQPPHDIMGLIVFTLPSYVWAALWCIGLLAAFFMGREIWRALRDRKKPEPVVPVTPTLDPIQKLKLRLQQLEPASLRDQKAYEEYFFELSMITRQALECRTGISFTDMTTRELEQPLKRKSLLPVQETQAVLSFLKAADTVKFSRTLTDVESALKYKQEVGRWLDKLGPSASARAELAARESS